MMMLCFAAQEIAPMTAAGIAKIRGRGVAITMTAKKRNGFRATSPLIAPDRTVDPGVLEI